MLMGWQYTANPAHEEWLTWIGYAIIGVGGLLLVLCNWQFSRHGTDSDCAAPDRALITSGPYRFSRNPIYLSFATIFAGLSLSSNAPMLVLIVPVMLWALNRFVVQPEEAHLEAVFEDTYRSYAGRVHRWI
jgi:protein-S-isoprenylcysteine O-methyltransferase Ste14